MQFRWDRQLVKSAGGGKSPLAATFFFSPAVVLCLATWYAPTSTPAADQQPAAANPQGQKLPAPPSQATQRLREGTEIVDQKGCFRLTSNRITFLPDESQQRFLCLENLNLERVARTIVNNPQPPQWTVTGTVTEYCGANYLFIRRAVLEAENPEEEMLHPSGIAPPARPQGTPE